MEILGGLYIEKRIQQTRTESSDSGVAFDIKTFRKTNAELARLKAKHGFPESTASHLIYDKTLPVSQKGEILAEAFENDAQRAMLHARISKIPLIQEYAQRKANRSRRIAQELRQAAQRSQNT